VTLDRLVVAAGIVDHVVTLDKLGLQYIGWLNKGDHPTALVGADSCDEAIHALASKLDTWLRTDTPPRFQQALDVLRLQPPGPSIWQRIRHWSPE